MKRRQILVLFFVAAWLTGILASSSHLHASEDLKIDADCKVCHVLHQFRHLGGTPDSIDNTSPHFLDSSVVFPISKLLLSKSHRILSARAPPGS